MLRQLRVRAGAVARSAQVCARGPPPHARPGYAREAHFRTLGLGGNLRPPRRKPAMPAEPGRASTTGARQRSRATRHSHAPQPGLAPHPAASSTTTSTAERVHREPHTAYRRKVDILQTHPKRDTFDLDRLRAAIDAASACASTCATCADACVHEDDPAAMARCIDLCSQCAAICGTTAEILSRSSPNGDSWRAIVQACIEVCRECAAECGQHAGHHEHCGICAEACRRCADACEALLAVAD